MRLENLSPSKGSRKNKKRIGRGQGSGKGGTSTRGHKGAKSRSGFSNKLGFEGGQLPFQRRVPKFGFKKKTKKSFFCINLSFLKEVTPDVFRQAIYISKHNFIKILGCNVLTYNIKISAHKFSKSSIKSIKSAGGEVIHLL